MNPPSEAKTLPKQNKQNEMLKHNKNCGRMYLLYGSQVEKNEISTGFSADCDEDKEDDVLHFLLELI